MVKVTLCSQVEVKALCQLCHTIINNWGHSCGQTWRIKVISTQKNLQIRDTYLFFCVHSKHCICLKTSELSYRNLWIIILSHQVWFSITKWWVGGDFKYVFTETHLPCRAAPKQNLFMEHTCSVSIVHHNVHFFPWCIMRLIHFS